MTPRRRAKPGIGLALAGGGPGGAAYEIGALVALEDTLAPLDLAALDVYVGVSAGAVVGASLANGVTPAKLVRGLAGIDSDLPPMTPEVMFTPAYREFMRRGALLPTLLAEVTWRLTRGSQEQETMRALARLLEALPIALFDGKPLRDWLHTTFSQDGRTDDFRKLRTRLIVVAADIASAESIRFGDTGWEHVPISVAVQASAALPGLYAPVNVDGRDCVDGVLLKTVHASVALEHGVDLLFCVNPIVPVDTAAGARVGVLPERVLMRRGLSAVLAQTFRTLIHSRMTVGFATYATRFPDADVVLFEPHKKEYGMFFSNIFAYSARATLCELAFRSTRRDLRRRRAELEPIFRRHGLTINDEHLTARRRTVWDAVGVEMPAERRGVGALRRSLLRLDEALTEAEAY